MSKPSANAADPRHCYVTALRKASRRLTQLYDDALSSLKVRSTQFTIMAEIHERGKEPPTMAELAEALVMDRSALGHNLRPLERDGLVALQTSESDRRRRHVVLTDSGKMKLVACVELWLAAQERIKLVIGEKKAADLREALLEVAYDDRLDSSRE